MTFRTAAPGFLSFFPWLVLGLAGSFVAGVLVEVQDVAGPDWLFLLLAPRLTAVWAAMAVARTLRRGRQLLASALLGAFLGSLVLMAGSLGTFFPFAAGLGYRDLELYGGEDFTWDHWLTTMLAWSGIGGAAFGVFGGFLSWAFRGQPQPG